MKKEYKFVNKRMEVDIVNEKGKVTSYKEIQCIATSEEEARTTIDLPKINESKERLDDAWELTGTYKLGKDWN